MKNILTALAIILSLQCSAQIYYVQDMTTLQIAGLDREKTIVILPGGILEEHGPYLPSFTDGYMNLSLTQSIAQAIAKRPGMKALIFPIIPLGSGGANEIPGKYTFSGTYTVQQHTLRSILMDISSELGDQGFRKIFVVHMHGAPNHNQAIDQACNYFADTYAGGRMVNIGNSILHFTTPQVFTPSQRKEEGFTVHGGASEHSMLYYLKPELISPTYKKALPVFAAGPNELAVVSKKNDWPGYWGSPKNANVAAGAAIWKALVNSMVTQVNSIIDGTYNYDQPTYFQLMSADAAQNAVNAAALKHDSEKEAKQRAWLKMKGFE